MLDETELSEISESLLQLAEDFNNFKLRQCHLEVTQLLVLRENYLEASAQNLEALVALSNSLSSLVQDLSVLAARLLESYRETLL